MRIQLFGCLIVATLLAGLALANPPSYLTQKMIDNYYGETTEEEIQTPDLLRQFAGESRLQYLLRRDGLTASLLVGKIVEKNPSCSDKQAYDEAWRTARTNRNSYIEIYEETIEIVPF